LAVKINGNRGTQLEICFNKSLKRNCTISTGSPNLGVWCKKWSNWASGVGQKHPSPTPSVVRNLTPPKNLRLLMTPALQPWSKVKNLQEKVMVPANTCHAQLNTSLQKYTHISKRLTLKRLSSSHQLTYSRPHTCLKDA